MEEEGRPGEEEEEKREERRIRIKWDEEARKIYKETANRINWSEERGDATEEKWEKLKKIILNAMVTEEVKVRRKNIGYRNWWDRN